MSLEHPSKAIILFFKGVLLMQALVMWLPNKIIGLGHRLAGLAIKGKKKIPNYMKVSPFPGSERVLTECVRNDGMMTFRWYSPKTDIECIVNFKKMTPDKKDLTLPLEITMATHNNEGELQYVHFAGVAVPIAKWDEKEFDEVKSMSKNGPTAACPEVELSVKTLSPEEADKLLGRIHDRIDPGSKVIN